MKPNKIEKIKLIDWSNKNRRCYFCGSDKSVKYDAVLVNGETVSCCNRCAFEYYVLGDE